MLGVRQANARVEEALKQVDLTSDADERVRFDFSGMQRRLTLARLPLQQPRLLLLGMLDELRASSRLRSPIRPDDARVECADGYCSCQCASCARSGA